MGYAESARINNRRLELTWFAPRSVWKKRVGKETKYFKTPNTHKGYLDALNRSAIWQAALDQGDDLQPVLAKYSSWYGSQGDPQQRGAAISHFCNVAAEQEFSVGELLRICSERPDVRQTLDLGQTPRIVFEELRNPRLWKDRLEGVQTDGLSISQSIDLFLAHKLEHVKAGVNKPTTFGDISELLGFAKKVLSGSLSSINEQYLENYYKHICKLRLSKERKKHLFNAFRRFVRWAWQQRMLEELPRNISNPFVFNGSTKDKSLMLFSPAEISSMLAKLPPRGRAFVLLGLNCGMTTNDLGNLKKENVDLEAGRIVYKRKKEEDESTVPVVNYKLWVETIKALAETKSKHPKLWFLTDQGRPLSTSTIVNGKHSRWSTLQKQWRDWAAKEWVPQKPQKGLRKTSTTLIEQSRFSGWHQLFCGHAPHGVTAKHYVVRSGEPIELFDQMLDWLRSQLLETKKPKPR